MSVLGLGVDIVEIDRMKLALERTPRIKERIFSEDERWYCEHKAKPYVHYAMRFAAKEAVLKALGHRLLRNALLRCRGVAGEQRPAGPEALGARGRTSRRTRCGRDAPLALVHALYGGRVSGSDHGRRSPSQGRAAGSQGPTRGLVQRGAGAARPGRAGRFGGGYRVSLTGGLVMRPPAVSSRGNDVSRTHRL